MKKQMTLKEKFQFFQYVFFNKEINHVSVNCHYCKSTNIKFNNGEEFGNNQYRSEYACQACGAKAINIEDWSK